MERLSPLIIVHRVTVESSDVQRSVRRTSARAAPGASRTAPRAAAAETGTHARPVLRERERLAIHYLLRRESPLAPPGPGQLPVRRLFDVRGRLSFPLDDAQMPF